MTNLEFDKPTRPATICSLATLVGAVVLVLGASLFGKLGTSFDGGTWIIPVLLLVLGVPALLLLSFAFAVGACVRREPGAPVALALALAVPVLMYLTMV